MIHAYSWFKTKIPLHVLKNGFGRCFGRIYGCVVTRICLRSRSTPAWGRPYLATIQPWESRDNLSDQSCHQPLCPPSFPYQEWYSPHWFETRNAAIHHHKQNLGSSGILDYTKLFNASEMLSLLKDLMYHYRYISQNNKNKEEDWKALWQ